MKMLEAEGLVTRKIHNGGADPRIALSGKGRHALDTYFEAGASPLGSGDELASGIKQRAASRD
jgi:hypothetical protein